MSNEEPIVLKSSAPIPTKADWCKWGYIISLILASFNLAVGFFGLMLMLFIEHWVHKSHYYKIRRLKFKFTDNVDADDIYNKLQPVLTQKYGNKVDFDRDGETLSVIYDGVIYDINPQEDGTFCVWWRLSLAESFFTVNVWKKYKKIRTGTVMVAYELQKAFNIN